MDVLGWVATMAGTGLVALALRDVFHTLLHPSGVGTGSSRIFRGVWRVARRLGPVMISLAGPLAMVVVVSTWAATIAAGWALVYWPHMPSGFVVSSGLDRGAQHDLVDALYFSFTALTTLGFGDLVADTAWLRLGSTLEGLTGFGLLTAAVTWVLSVYPALMRRRALAGRISGLLVRDEDGLQLRPGDPPQTLAQILHSIAEEIWRIDVDFVHYPSTYFFHAPGGALAFPAQVVSLRAALDGTDLPEGAASAAEAVRVAIRHLAETLGNGPYALESSGDVLQGYEEEHRVPGG